MEDTSHLAIAIVGIAAIMPDAPDAASFWSNIVGGRYCIGDVPEGRWDPALYYDADTHVPDKTYSRIGGWVKSAPWDPVGWRLPIPPRVAEAMDEGQRWALACARAALADFGYPGRPLDLARTAVILGNAMAGERHYLTSLRIAFPEYARWLGQASAFQELPAEVRAAILEQLRRRVGEALPAVNEDTMPGELANCIAGRIANTFDLHGPNFTCDAACASAMAAMSAAREGLIEGDFDAVISGGIDRNMGAATFVKFSKIGALSATGTRPFAEGADGFVMGEGAALFVLKRLADAEAAGDKIYAVIRGMAGSSDGRGKGITAPNPVGQRLAIARAWKDAGVSPCEGMLVEAHGTSTPVGDVVEVKSLMDSFGPGLGRRSIALGSVKSNVGHLKGAAGAAGLFKAVMALHERVLPASLNFKRPNPNIEWDSSPFYVNTETRPWDAPSGGVRRAAVSAFGFGGTNFHMVLEEHRPGQLASKARGRWAASAPSPGASAAASAGAASKAPLRGALVLGASTEAELARRLADARAEAEAGRAPPWGPPSQADLDAAERVAIDFGDASELAAKVARAQRALESVGAGAWKALRAQGIFRGAGPRPKVAFLYTGQGSQYVNMLRGLRESEGLVREQFAEADRILGPTLGRPLSSYLFVDAGDEAAIKDAEASLRQTAITQPAVLAVDIALTRLLEAFGVRADMVMGHSLGEYGALVAAGGLPFEDALEAVSARGKEMAHVAATDHGKMAAVMGPLPEIERRLRDAVGYVIIANVNSNAQVVIGGSSDGVADASARLTEAGFQVVPLSVSHAFHTSIVAPASEPLRRVLARLRLRAPSIPIVANTTGDFYPEGASPADMIDTLAAQVASPVQFVKGLHSLYEAGARVFVEVGPKKALAGFAEDVLGAHADVLTLFTNHPKLADAAAFNQALCGLYSRGLGAGIAAPLAATGAGIAAPLTATGAGIAAPLAATGAAPSRSPVIVAPEATAAPTGAAPGSYESLGRMVAELVERAGLGGARRPRTFVTGAALGLPGTPKIFDDGNVARILHGEQLIDVIPVKLRSAIVDKHITRLVKKEGKDPVFETIDSAADVIKLAGRGGSFDLSAEYGVPAERVEAFDVTTRLAFAVGLDALRDAGIPLVPRYKTTSKGTYLPDGWALPEALRDDTGIVFASAFPGYDALIGEITHHFEDHSLRERLAELRGLKDKLQLTGGAEAELERRIGDVEAELAAKAYSFDRRFLFRVLSMGHSQFAEHIRARGPNTQVNAACASTTQAIAVAEDWIAAGRCRRVVVVAADDITTDTGLGWFGTGFLASGAAATEDVVEEVATPFDRRRHGMLVGMGAAALVVETEEAARERGVSGICEVLGTAVANSAFHGTRLDVEHISSVMESLVLGVEQRWGVPRGQIGEQLVFVSHETYTPARGGSAAAEIFALRRVFGASADRIVIANTKGFTGHAMGAGIEDVVAVKALETGIVPPVPNFKEIDPDLGSLNLSKGGVYPVEYALRLGAGFGSQICMSLLRRSAPGPRPAVSELGFARRVTDKGVFDAALAKMSGYAAPALEVVGRTLRVKDQGPAGRVATKPAPQPAPIAPAQPTPAASQPVPPTPAPQPAVKPAAPAPKPVAATASTLDSVEERVLALVAEKTGYPRDMLALDLDLEADLGVDTVKQAEVFAGIRGAYQIPREESLKLRDYPTLAHVIGFVKARIPGGAASPIPSAAPAAPVAIRGSVQAAAPLAPAADGVEERVLALVAEKTGYPRDMLALDLDLEADLGVDTVKQAEVFAGIRGAYQIPREESLKLRDYPTLAHVIGFVRDRLPKKIAPAAPAAPAAAPEPPVGPFKLASVEPSRFLRRVPVPVLRVALGRCLGAGIELGGRRVLVMADEGGVAEALAEALGRRGADVLLVSDAPEAEALVARVEGWLASGPIHGVYWLPGLGAEEPLAQLDEEGFERAVRLRVKLAYAAARALYASLEREGSFFVAATRLGGQHGYDEAGAQRPLGGGVTGFTKALKRERPSALVKCVDLEVERGAGEIAALLIEETLRDPGTVEVGYKGGLRWGVGLSSRPVSGAPELPVGGVYVVTGAAGSITSAITADLAAASRGTFYLLDLAPAPAPDGRDAERLITDREGLKRDLFERIKARGERATPALVEKELMALERDLAARRAIQAVEAAGGAAHYHSVDLRDGAAVAAIVERIRKDEGRIDTLIHAAGLEISRSLPDKSPGEFELVFDVKARGLHNLLRAAGSMPIGTVVVFSSVAGRFGNVGQTDYSAANDLLSKVMSSFRTHRPETRGISIDWTAWSGIGMASRGSIPRMMELAGIEPLPPEEGVPVVRRELASGRGDEVVVAGALGTMLEDRSESGGVDPGAFPEPRGPMLGRVVRQGRDGVLVVETVLEPSAQPFLHDHAIDGTPVLPGVMGIEAFVELASLLLPGWSLDAIEDVDFLAPFKFYRGEPRALRLTATLEPEGPGIVARCALSGTRDLPGQPPQTTTHFTGRVLLGPPREARVQTRKGSLPARVGAELAAEDIYRVYFHGPAYRVLESAWRSEDGSVAKLASDLPADRAPGSAPTLAEPRWIEACFQAAGVWDIGTTGKLGLPAHVDRIEILGKPASDGVLYAVAVPGEAGYSAQVIGEQGGVRAVLRGYRTVHLPEPVSPELARPFARAMAAPVGGSD